MSADAFIKEARQIILCRVQNMRNALDNGKIDHEHGQPCPKPWIKPCHLTLGVAPATRMTHAAAQDGGGLPTSPCKSLAVSNTGTSHALTPNGTAHTGVSP